MKYIPSAWNGCTEILVVVLWAIISAGGTWTLIWVIFF